MKTIICVCRAPGAIPSNRLRPTVGTTSPAAESDCFIRAAIFGPSTSGGTVAVLASCRSRPSGASLRSCCNSTAHDWFKPANFGTPNFADDGCRMGTLARPTSGANTVGQECPTYCRRCSTACGSTASTFPTRIWETSASGNDTLRGTFLFAENLAMLSSQESIFHRLRWINDKNREAHSLGHSSKPRLP